MSMPMCGTFDYVGTLEPGEGDSFACQLQLREPIVYQGDPLLDERLMGPGPRLTIARRAAVDVADVEAARSRWLTRQPPTLRDTSPGATPTVVDVLRWTLTRGDNAPVAPERGWWPRSVPRTRRVSRVTFDTHVALRDVMRPGDGLHLRRDNAAALGLSVLRSGQLVLAIGDVTQVALGDGLHANWLTPPHLLALPILSPEMLAEESNRSWASSWNDPDSTKTDATGAAAPPRWSPFEPAAHPLCLTAGVDVSHLGAGQSVLVGGVRTTVLRSFDSGGIPVRATGCALIWRESLVPEAIVRASAVLLDTTFTLAED